MRLALPFLYLAACSGGSSAPPDARVQDASDTTSDTGASDTGASDTGASDTGVADTGVADTAASDAGVDTSANDTGVSDTGLGTDASGPDARVRDAGPATDSAIDAGMMMPTLVASTFVGGSGVGGAPIGIGGEGLRHCLVSSRGDLVLSGSGVERTPVTAGAYQTDYAGGGYNGDSWVARMSLDLSTLTHATYLGGSANEREAYNVVERADGTLVVAGHTDSTDFPTTAGAFDRTLDGMSDGYVSILSGNLTRLVASTYLGGFLFDSVRGDIILHPDGSIVVTGSTESASFPTRAAFQPTYGGGFNDGFVTAFEPDLRSLRWSTFIGGDAAAWSEYIVSGVTIATGAIVVVGSSPSGSFLERHSASTVPLPDGRLASPDGTVDMFVAALTPPGPSGSGRVEWLNILSDASNDDWAEAGMTVDSEGNFYVVGVTTGNAITTRGAHDRTYGGGGGDCLVVKISADGRRRIWGTLVGGDGYDTCLSPSIDRFGNVWIVGQTASTDFPTTSGAYDRVYGGNADAYVAALSPDGSRIVYASYVGGPNEEYYRWSCSDPDKRRLYAVGWSRSPDFPTTAGAYQETFGGGGQDMVVSIFQLP